MNESGQLCSDADRMLQFLSGRLSENEERVVERHLDGCTSCRSLLEQTAADQDSWIEASELLVDDPWRSFLCQTRIEGESDGSPLSLQIKHVLEMLQPTDDPEMLGRLGGYEVSGVVGSGGMGVVLKAADRSLDRTVAIKVLSPHLASSGAARTRFEREAKAAAAVIHPNVIAIHAVSKDTTPPFLVMPYLRGVTLQNRVDREGPLPLVDVLRIGAQIASGLAAAHRQGLVHRDIKPANILLEDGVERVAITDFGLARAVDDASLTRTGIIAGTPQYMSPEQAGGEAVDHRTDLFSLGSVLYTICTGRLPFRADTTFGILRRITDKMPQPIRDSNPETPHWLCKLIEKLHAKPVEQRYQSADEVAVLFEQCLAHVQTPNAPLPEELRETKPRWAAIAAMAFLAATVLLVISISVVALIDPAMLNRTLPTGGGPSPSAPTQPLGELEPLDTTLPADYRWDDESAPTPDEIYRRARQLGSETRIPFALGSDEPVMKPALSIKEIHDE